MKNAAFLFCEVWRHCSDRPVGGSIYASQKTFDKVRQSWSSIQLSLHRSPVSLHGSIHQITITKMFSSTSGGILGMQHKTNLKMLNAVKDFSWHVKDEF